MNTIWTIARNDLRIFLADKAGYVWLFGMPLVFIYFFGITMRAEQREPTNPRPRVAIDNRDEGDLGELFVGLLDDEGLAVVASDDEQQPTRTITIPRDFSQHIMTAEQVDVRFDQQPGTDAQPAAMVQVRVTRAIIRMTSAIVSAVAADDASQLTKQSLENALQRAGPVSLDVSFAGRRQVPSGFQQSVPGYMVMFVLMNLTIFGGQGIALERSQGILRRMAVYPVDRGQVVTGKILGRFLLGVVQIVYLLVVSWALFGMDYGGNLPLTCLTLLIWAWGCAALGTLIGALFRRTEVVQGICTLVSVVIAALGGCWWPLEVVPATMHRIGNLLPTAWAMSALHQLISFGGGLAQIQSPLLLLSAFAVVVTAAASWRLSLAAT